MGAWVHGPLRRGMDGRSDPLLAGAILSFKRALRVNGAASPALRMDLPVFGDAMARSVADFQAGRGLKVDGLVGTVTAREMFRLWVSEAASAYDVAAVDLARLLQLESGWDPSAVGGRDPDDRGVAQINRRAHPDVSDREAFDPELAIFWAARFLSGLRVQIAAALGVDDAALAGYNVGASVATSWARAGLPGGTQAATYVTAVRRQNVGPGW